MVQEIISGPLGEIRAASTASGGTALTSTAQFLQLPFKTHYLIITPRNFAGVAVVKYLFNPWLVVLKTADGMATAPIDYSKVAQDADSATDVVLSSLSTLANGDFLLVGSHQKFRGCYADVDSTNGDASVLTVTYWDGQAWTTTGATDGTILVAGKTLGQDALIYWTVPVGNLWKREKLSVLYPDNPLNEYSDIPLYWTRWVVSAALDSSVTLNSLVSANRSTAYAEFLSGQNFEGRILHGLGGIGCIEALTNAGTANLIINAATIKEGGFN